MTLDWEGAPCTMLLCRLWYLGLQVATILSWLSQNKEFTERMLGSFCDPRETEAAKPWGGQSYGLCGLLAGGVFSSWHRCVCIPVSLVSRGAFVNPQEETWSPIWGVQGRDGGNVQQLSVYRNVSSCVWNDVKLPKRVWRCLHLEKVWWRECEILGHTTTVHRLWPRGKN